MRSAVIVLLLLMSSCASTKPVNDDGFEIQLNEAKPNSSQRANIEIRVMRSDGKPVSGLPVSLLDSQIDTETNRQGIVTIEIPDAQFKDRIKILGTIIPIDLRGYDRILAFVVN